MNPRRFATMAAVLCETAFVACIAGFGSTGTANTGAAPVAARSPASLAADVPRAIAIDSAAVENVEMTTVAKSATVTDTAAAPDEPKSIVAAAPTEPPQTQPTETAPEPPPVHVAMATPPDAMLEDAKDIAKETAKDGAKDALSSIEIVDECLVPEICIDRYLYALYERTPKLDSIKVDEERRVTVKKKGKTVTVTRTFSKVVDEDFAWKDPKAAAKAGMPMIDYVIGGMDRSFKERLFYFLHAADEAGLAPGITSAFRDDYRQSIASGLKAASDRSYHGGSTRGGYGHGLAADVVSVKGTTRAQRQISTEILWKWIDAHEKVFGIGRPYLDHDPPHVGPIDGKEYVSKRGTKDDHAGSDAKEHKAARDDHGGKKRTARSSKTRTT
jgi:hypothetical protein